MPCFAMGHCARNKVDNDDYMASHAIAAAYGIVVRADAFPVWKALNFGLW
jgi:hypothetical protein